MKFNGKQHQEFYAKYGSIYEGKDYQRQVLFYLLGVSESCRRNINSIYDFTENLIKPECLHAGWQTSSSRALTRLAFDLYHGDPVVSEDADDLEAELTEYSVSNIMSKLHEWLPFALEAINIVY